MDTVINLDTLKKFIELDENNKNFKLNGVYLIERVIYLNDINALDYLLSIDANIIIPKLMKIPIKFNNKEIIDKLFNYSSQSYEIVDNKKYNAFHYAIHYFNNYVIDYLIDKIDLFNLDYKNNSYLHYAIKKKNNYVIKKIIDKIFNDRNIDDMNKSLIHIFNIMNNDNDTPLLLMVKNNIDYKIENIIDDLYVNLNIQNKNYDFILSYACINLNKNLLNILFNTYNYVNWNLQNKEGDTLIHILIKYNHLDIVELLLNMNLNINVNIYNIDFEIPLITLLKKIKRNVEIFNKYNELIDLLFNMSLYFHIDKKGNCILYYLLKYFDFYCKKKLFHKKIKNIVNNKGISLKDIDKNNIFIYEDEKENKQLLNINYSTLPFDILCFMINLNVNYNIYINIDLDKLKINSTLNNVILNLFLLWNGEIHNLDLLNSIVHFKKSNNKFMILFLMIEYENINHSNVLIINNNLVYRFDPYGYYYHDKYDLDNLDKILNDKVEQLNKEFNLNYKYDFFNKQVGIQQLEDRIYKNVNDLNGYCVSWCMMIINDIILNDIYNIDMIINMYNTKSYYEKSLKFIQETANKFRDIILLDCNIPFIKYYNNDLSIEESKKIINSMKKIINLYKKK